jgi:serine/threonine-protein kinase MRCK
MTKAYYCTCTCGSAVIKFCVVYVIDVFSELDLTGERRLRQLEALFLGGPIQGQGQSFSVETLLDVLLVLYDECCNSSLRREKTVSDFIEFGKI